VLKQQAVRELQQQGRSTDNAAQLQFKVAEILARQQRHRRGFRREAAPLAQTNEEDAAREAKESIAKKLEAAAQLLKRGMFAPPRENVKQETHTDDYRYSHIKRFEGEIERPFAAKEQDNQGLTGFVSFNDFDLSGYTGPAGGDAAAAHRSSRRDRHSRKKDKHRGDKRALSKSSSRGDKHREERHAKKKHRGEKGASASSSGSSSKHTPEGRIYRYVSKVVDASRGQAGGADASSRLLKAVRRKTAAKVVEDWASKPRGDLSVQTWLNDKRKAKIQELVNRYMQLYSQSSTGGAAAAAAEGAASSAAAPSHSGYSQVATDPRSALHQPVYHAVPQQPPEQGSAAPAQPAVRGPRFNPSSSSDQL